MSGPVVHFSILVLAVITVDAQLNLERNTTDPSKTPADQPENTTSNLPASQLQSTINSTEDIADKICDIPEDFNVEPSSFNITITWDLPSDPECVPSYDIFLNNELVGNVNTTSYTFINLTACEDYKIGLSSISNTTNIKAKTAKTELPSNFYDYNVENFEVIKLENALNLTWDPPLNVEKCITSYAIHYWNQNGGTTDENPTVTFLEISPIIGCMIYTFEIAPLSGAANVGKNLMKNHTADAQVATPPIKKQGPQANQTSMEATWEVQSKDENMCVIDAVIVTCDAKESDLGWIVKHQTKEYKISSNGYRFPIVIEGLSEFTNYTCTASARNTAGLSQPSDPIIFQTLEDIPEVVEDLNSNDVTATSFKITWKEPKKVPGVQLEYFVLIKSGEALHYIDDDCKGNTAVKHDQSVDAKKYEYEFTKAFPDFQYDVTVFGNTEGANGGNGTTQTIQVSTLIDNPPPPMNVTHEIFPSDNPDEYNVTVKITWRAPCNPNGPMNGFYLSFKGTADVDHGPHQNDEPIFIKRHDDETDLTYSYDIANIAPAHNYTVEIFVELINDTFRSENATDEFVSPDGYPGQPTEVKILNATSEAFLVTWSAPADSRFKILHYNVTVKKENALHPTPDDDSSCKRDEPPWTFQTDGNAKDLHFDQAKPHYNYSVYVKAFTSLGSGKNSDPKTALTAQGRSDPVRNIALTPRFDQSEQYRAAVDVKFELPCDLNGNLSVYRIMLKGNRQEHPDDRRTKDLSELILTKFENLKPDYDYIISVTVITTYDEPSEEVSSNQFRTDSGVPSLIDNVQLDPPFTNATTRAYFNLNRADFSEENGEIVCYALLLSTNSDDIGGDSYGFWNESKWPDSGRLQQITEDFWKPFTDTDGVSFVIGADKECEAVTPCNKELQPDTEYFLTVRILTRNAYRDITALRFKTNTIDDLNLPLILGLIFGLLTAGCLAVFIVYLWRRKQKKLMDKPDVVETVKDPKPIAIRKFTRHYEHLESNYDIVKSQYTSIQMRSREINLPITYAVLTENRRKNRWTNILPYDDTRVKLKMDEDDEICSDYINASYIRGYSGNVEYIATQGPLETTTKDFWKMVFQENVTIIVMVTQFIEQSKEKCFKYFPNNHESLMFDDVEVRCSTELHFGTYCIRTLQIKRDTVQQTVYHMQFLEWPDFGVPTGTESMLHFCTQMRERHEKEDGLILIHCSAGVGRTGTLIALDILLQTVDHDQDIDVFKTVMDLRKQRTHMVQHEKQYMFLFTCLRDAIENPIPKPSKCDCDPQFHTYENLTMMSPEETSAILPPEESAL